MLGPFALAMINVAAIASLRDLPQMAKYGIGCVFFYLLAGLIFFFPVSLVAAELATGWPERGGVYVWVREAFGRQHGFAAVFIQWFQNLCWYPVVLTFAAASLGFAIDPQQGADRLADNKTYICAVILITYWGTTLWNFRGLKASAKLSVMGAFSGVIIPGAALITLAALYLITGQSNHLDPSAQDFLPNMTQPGNITFAASVLLAFAGMEMTAVHVRETRNPKRTYPIAIAIAAGIILLAFVLGALSISVALAPDQYTLQTGVTDALDTMLAHFSIPGLGRVFAGMMALGVIGSVNSWIIGPSKGLLAAARDGMLPPWFSKTNEHGIPTRVLFTQAVIVSILCLSFTLQPTVADAYFMLSDLTIQLYLIMYLAMFSAAIRLRYSHPNTARAFRIPFENIGMWAVGGFGILGALSCMTIGFFPPTQLLSQGIRPDVFVCFLLFGILLVVAIPYGINRFSRHAEREAMQKRIPK